MIYQALATDYDGTIAYDGRVDDEAAPPLPRAEWDPPGHRRDQGDGGAPQPVVGEVDGERWVNRERRTPDSKPQTPNSQPRSSYKQVYPPSTTRLLPVK